jgi:hypothetical protein
MVSAQMRSPLIAGALIVAVLIGGLPVLTGVVVVADSKPAFTLDICHPVSGALHGLDQSEAPVIPTHAAAQFPMELGAAPEFVATFSPRENKAPDPPPPKV